jgi:rod shape-determining protein MreC
MESFLNRYRNITVLLLVIFAQMVLLAVQVKNDREVPVIRVWTVTAVTPVARVIEGLRQGSVGFVRNYILLHDADADNRRLRDEVGRLKIENIFLKNELNTADRAKALTIFEARTPSKMLAATVVGTGAGAGTGSKVVFIDRGTASGVERGMGVVTPDGIAGKVIAAYPTASEVLLVTDPDFAAGVISQKNGARGTLKGQGTPECELDYVPLEEKIELGEMLFTTGDDRIFPRGFPAGVVRVVRTGPLFQQILVEPIGLQHGLEDVLIIVEGVHQEIPAAPPVNQQVYIAPPPPASGVAPAPAAQGVMPAPVGTEADRLRSAYKAVGDAQNHVFGEGLPGSKPPDFTQLGSAGSPKAASPAGTKPAAGAPGAPPSATKPAAGAPGVPPAGTKPATGAVVVPQARPAPPPKPSDTERKANQAAGAGPGEPGR